MSGLVRRSVTARRLADGLIVPALFYFVGFALLTWPLITKFSTHFFADDADGLQNVWNVWWVNRAVTVRHQSPWYTTDLHYPGGVTLVAHTLNPFNGFVGIGLLRFLSLTQTFNVMVLFGFVGGGITAFWLCRELTRAYWPSLVGGAIFTFSEFHFAHAQGHLQLVSLEWLPLFVLLWYRLLLKPRFSLGVGAGLSLVGLILCDYYYFTYALETAAVLVGWRIYTLRKGCISEIDEAGGHAGPPLRPLAAFAVVALLGCGPLVVSLARLAAREPLLGIHEDWIFALDLFAPFIPGGHWRFAALTEPYWAHLLGNPDESSTYVGWSVIALLAYVWRNRPKAGLADLPLWFGLLVGYLVLSFGPSLHVVGIVLPIPLPYGLLELLVPPLRLSGMPNRMMVMVMLCAGIIAAAGLRMLFAGPPRMRRRAFALLALLAVEYLPAPLPATRVAIPAYVRTLAALPSTGGVLDVATNRSYALYDAIVDGKPYAFGYVSRLPLSVVEADQAKIQLFDAHQYGQLCRTYNLRYVVTYTESGPDPVVLDLAPGGACAETPVVVGT